MILVTGASGFLGLHLLPLLVTQNKPIRAVYNSTKPKYEHPLVQWQQADLLDVFAVEQLFVDVTHVYNCAAIVSFDASDKEILLQNNITCTQNIVNEALEANVQKLIHVSSIASLGRTDGDQFITEETYWVEHSENSIYARSKYGAEMEVWRAIAEGLNAAIVNPGIILGEGDYSKGSAQLMANVANEFPYYTNGVNGYVDVQDVAAAMMLLMDSDIANNRFILNEGNYSYKDIFTEMAQSLGVKPPHKYAAPWMTEIVWRLALWKAKLGGKHPLITKETARTARSSYYYSNTKFLHTFPTFRYTPMKATIARMAADYRRTISSGK